MKSVIFFLGVVCLLFFGCSKYEDLLDSRVKPGYIYCGDGSVIHPSQYGTSPSKAIGVIFWTNTDKNVRDKAYAVALADIKGTRWASANVHIDNVSSDAADFFGLSNTAAMILYNKNDSTISMPAVDSVQNYMPEVSWYIPSSGQLSVLSGNLETVREALKAVGGEALSGWYWSSTEDNTSEAAAMQYALTVSVSNGAVVSGDKTNKYNIRPVITIR